MAWTTLKTERDWQAFYHAAEMSSSCRFLEDNSPVEYPCLVTVLETNDGLLRAAVVYRADALALLGTPPPAQDAVWPQPQNDAIPAQRSMFDMHNVANHMTVQEILIDTSIVKRPDYDRRFARNLAIVEQWSAEEKKEWLRSRSVPATGDDDA